MNDTQSFLGRIYAIDDVRRLFFLEQSDGTRIICAPMTFSFPELKAHLDKQSFLQVIATTYAGLPFYGVGAIYRVLPQTQAYLLAVSDDEETG